MDLPINKTIAESIFAKLAENSIEPDYTFTAAAGSDYGQVDAYALPDHTNSDGLGYVVKTNTGNQTEYDFVTDEPTDSDCREWLAPDDNDSVTIGNILGIDAVSEATNPDDGPFMVLVSRDYYGPESVCSLVTDDTGNRAEFDTIEAAQDWIDEVSQGVYTCEHNETGRPDYKIVNY